MHLILSTEYDITTSEVIDWLDYFEIPFIRINDTATVSLESLTISMGNVSWKIRKSDIFNQQEIIIDSESIKSFWYRRGKFTIEHGFEHFPYQDTKYIAFYQKMQSFISRNNDDLVNFLYNNLKSYKYLGFFYDNYTQKLHNLILANKMGLLIPSTKVINCKSDLKMFLQKYGRCITKGINENGFTVKDEIDVGCLTELITKSDLDDIPESFANSLVQEYIEKLYELRVFYLNEACYASAIFSQNDVQTKIDFRNYNYATPNRIVPYKLPEQINDKINEFMKHLGMKTGSLDLIVSQKLEYIFLEVNPIGQFSWASKKCNYELEKVIAEYFKQN